MYFDYFLGQKDSIFSSQFTKRKIESFWPRKHILVECVASLLTENSDAGSSPHGTQEFFFLMTSHDK